LVRQHIRLLIATLIGCIAFFVVPLHWTLLSRVLIAWNVGVVVFLVTVIHWMMGLSAEQLHSKYADEDESAPFILLAVTIAAIFSLVAIIDPLAQIKTTHGATRIGHLVLAAMTLVDSWLLVPTMFTIHYADMFYSDGQRHRPLHFPDTHMPVFWDFAYFSFTIAAACQTADVSTAQGPIRKIVLAHSLVSFLFNASILGFAINISAGLLGSN
jgi:uncharacterized membrane protein